MALDPVIKVAQGLVGHTEEEARRVLGEGTSLPQEDDYQRMDILQSMENPSRFPGTLYLKDGRVELIYLGDAAVADMDRRELEKDLPGRPVRMRSRAGKKASLYVHAEDGVAYSAQGDKLDFIEVFRPRSRKEYEAEIFLDPPDFIR